MKTKLIPTALLIAALGFSVASTAQSYCVPPGFKSIGGVGEPFTFISKVQLGSLTNTSGMPTGAGNDNGYKYYDNVTVPQLTKGEPYDLKITANDNLGMSMGVVVWIDWNNDGMLL